MLILLSLLNYVLAISFKLSDSSLIVNSDYSVITRQASAPELKLAASRGAGLAPGDHYFFFKQKADEVQPIASITKLMTALVFLENNPGWDKVYQIERRDLVEGGKWNLFLGEKVLVRDLFYMSLVASDNGATQALVHASNLSNSDFVSKMNEKAVKLGLNKTSFVDPIGLGEKNISTAEEVAYLAQAAFLKKEIAEATTRRSYKFTTLDGKLKEVESTDYLLYDDKSDAWEVIGGKTGYTDQAGYCFVGYLRAKDGREIISVVLNSPGKNDRFLDSKKIVNWVFNNYYWTK